MPGGLFRGEGGALHGLRFVDVGLRSLYGFRLQGLFGGKALALGGINAEETIRERRLHAVQPYIGGCQLDRFHNAELPGKGHSRDSRRKQAQRHDFRLVFARDLADAVESLYGSPQGIDPGYGRIGINKTGLEQFPLGRQPIERALYPVGGGFGGGPEFALHDLGELREQILGGELAVGHELVELRRGHAHSLGRKLERTREALTKLPAQFFRLYLALADHLAEGKENALHVVLRQGERGPGG